MANASALCLIAMPASPPHDRAQEAERKGRRDLPSPTGGMLTCGRRRGTRLVPATAIA